MTFKSIPLVIFFSFLQYSLISAQNKPCAGHDVRVHDFKNCPEPAIKSQNIRIYNITASFSEDCKLLPRGCFIVKKTISNAKVEYYVHKPPFKKTGLDNFCEMLERPTTQKILQSYRTLPKRCDIPPGDFCISKGSTTINQLNSRTLNLLTGTSSGTFTIESEDSGDKACVEFKMTVTKKA